MTVSDCDVRRLREEGLAQTERRMLSIELASNSKCQGGGSGCWLAKWKNEPERFDM